MKGKTWLLFLGILMLATHTVLAQPKDAMAELIQSLTPGPIPESLLAAKTVALFQPAFSTRELEQIQTGFERTGIDLVLYYPVDYPFSNAQIQKVFSDYLVKREIKYLLFLKKTTTGYEFVFTEFDKTPNLISAGQSGWIVTDKTISEISLDIYRTALNNQKRVNMLVSPLPEIGLKLKFIRGQRYELYATDLKVDKLAIIKFGDAQWDGELEALLKLHYPFQYALFEPGTTEVDIRKKGYLFIMNYFHVQGKAAMEFLEYNMSRVGNSIASISYQDGQLQLKSIPAEEPVYKFYFKQLENNNVYLGTKWDADADWKQALINQIKGLKAELRIN